MNVLLLTLFLAFAWVVLTGQVTAQNFMVGVLLGGVLLWVVRRAIGQRAEQTFGQIPKLISFALLFLRELIIANFRVLVTVLMPRRWLRPAIISVPLDLQSNAGITLLANLITLTPGTLALDVSDDRCCLYVHTIYVTDEDEFRQEIKAFEKRLMEVLG